MKNSLFAVFTLSLCLFIASAASAQEPIWVGGKKMYANKDIVSNAIQSNEHTTLVAAVKAAGLVKTLQGTGPFTVFAPVNDAFENLPQGTVETLLKPENKGKLTKILTYHVVAGSLDSKSIRKAIQKSGGKAVLTTVSGDKLTAMMNGESNVILQDENGGIAHISTYDVKQSNGMIHVIDQVILPQ